MRSNFNLVSVHKVHMWFNTWKKSISSFDYFITKHTPQWRIQEFQNRGTRSRSGRILGVWVLLWCPFTHIVCFCSESGEWDTYCKHCMLTTTKENACYTVKIFKNKLPKIFKQGGARPVRRSWIRLCSLPALKWYSAYGCGVIIPKCHSTGNTHKHKHISY